MNNIKTIVIGSLSTDIVASGIERFPEVGGHVYGKELRIGPGGKARNITQMIASLSDPGSTAMIGRTAKDKYGFWQEPIQALQDAGVNVDYIRVLDESETEKLPGIALIPVDKQGRNQIFVLPGVSDDFSPSDIDQAAKLFQETGAATGTLVSTFECPKETVVRAIEIAHANGLKVILDPGGLQVGDDVSEILSAGLFVIKPNEHEAEMLTGVKVRDEKSAEVAAAKLLAQGIEYVFITIGDQGGYLFGEGISQHVPVTKLPETEESDSTGCGDQTTAAFSVAIRQGKDVPDAARIAILAGSMQFHRAGIQPVMKDELAKHLEAR